MKGGNDNERREWRSGGGDDDGITINCPCGVELLFMVGEVKTSAAELAAAAKTAAARCRAEFYCCAQCCAVGTFAVVAGECRFDC